MNTDKKRGFQAAHKARCLVTAQNRTRMPFSPCFIRVSGGGGEK